MPKHFPSIGLVAFAGTLLLGVAGLASAQGDRPQPPLPVGKRPVPASLAQAAPAQPPVATTAPVPSPPREWTGESGSSGHPLMQATAIRQAAANFEQCLEGLWPLAQKRGVSRATYDKHVGGLTPGSDPPRPTRPRAAHRWRGETPAPRAVAPEDGAGATATMY